MSVHCINNHHCEGHLPVPHDDLLDFEPVSALYAIKVGSGKMCKPVTIVIQHCSNSSESDVMLLRASNERDFFRPVTDALFDPTANCCRIIAPQLAFPQEYNDFSWFIITMRRLFFRNTIHYKARVYISKATIMMHFIVTMALDLCSTVSCGYS